MFDRTPQLRWLPRIAGTLVVLAIALVAIPFSHRGFPSGHDATTHITYTYLFDRALGQGQLPVRWVEWVRAGESQPLFNFYYPGLYYLISVVHASGLPLMVSYEATIVLLWWSGAIFLFAFLNPWGKLPAALGAALFALSPYVILDGFVRAAYAELAAVGLAPGVLWACDRLLRTGRTRYLLAAAALTGLMLVTHLPSVLIFAPAFGAYALYLTASSRTTIARLGQLALAVALGCGLAAFYILPSLGELHLATMSKMTSGYFDYRRHFVLPEQWFWSSWGFGASEEGPNDGLSFQLGRVQIAFAAAGFVCALLALLRSSMRKAAGDLVFWLAIASAALFVMTAASEPLWQRIPQLSYLQFPWRFLMLASLALAVIAARVLSLVRSPALQAAIVIAALGVHLFQHARHLEPATYIPRQVMHIDDPNWADTEDAQTSAFIDRGFTPLVAELEARPGIGQWLVEGEGRVTVDAVEMADDRMVFDIDTQSPAILHLHTHAFPGWRAWIDGAETTLRVASQSGYMAVDVPAGAHRIETRFTDTPIRRTANAITAASIVVWLTVLILGRRAKRAAAADYEEPARSLSA